MASDRLDDLAVALGRATSRRNALKILAVGGVAAILGRATSRFGSDPSSSATGLPVADLVQAQPSPNVLSGTCSTFVTTARQRGVIDNRGVGHPSAYGWTDARPASGPVGWTEARRRQGWKCPCKPEILPTQQECDDYCGRGLSGCIVKCGGGGVCITSTPVTLTYSAPPTISKLQWVPPVSEKELSAGCKSHLSDVNRHINEHEQHHADDIRAVESEFNARPPKTYEECGNDANQAAAKIDTKIGQDIAADLAAIETEINTRISAYHATPDGGRLVDFKCELCPY